MNNRLRKIMYIGLTTLMVTGLSTSILSNQSVNASINIGNYGIDVFPNKQTHNRFAYQLRNRGHNSRIYYASKNSKLGQAIFNEGIPNNDYANYMARYHHKLFHSIIKKLERKVIHHHAKAKRLGQYVIRRTKRVRRYNHKIRKNHCGKVIKSIKGQNVLKSRFKRSNNKFALKRSGFFDAHSIGGNFIFDKYSPNDKRAVVPKDFNGTNWYQGKFGQVSPIGYYYDSLLHGWIMIK